jgi:hypothetical protein
MPRGGETRRDPVPYVPKKSDAAKAAPKKAAPKKPAAKKPAKKK